jgi:hypothetical protein
MNMKLFLQTLSDERLQAVFSGLSRKGHTAVVFGGAIRDTLLLNKIPDDFDVVVRGISNTELEEVLNYELTGFDYELTKNSFGGLKYCFKDKLELDIWSFEESWPKKHFWWVRTLDDLPKTSILNSEAVIYYQESGFFTTGEMEYSSFNRCLEEKIIELNNENNLKDRIFSHIKKYAPIFDKNGYQFGNRIKKWVWSYYAS